MALLDIGAEISPISKRFCESNKIVCEQKSTSHRSFVVIGISGHTMLPLIYLTTIEVAIQAPAWQHTLYLNTQETPYALILGMNILADKPIVFDFDLLVTWNTPKSLEIALVANPAVVADDEYSGPMKNLLFKPSKRHLTIRTCSLRYVTLTTPVLTAVYRLRLNKT